jgi:hypothetical protein
MRKRYLFQASILPHETAGQPQSGPSPHPATTAETPSMAGESATR